jgi:hypothetical protein
VVIREVPVMEPNRDVRVLKTADGQLVGVGRVWLTR